MTQYKDKTVIQTYLPTETYTKLKELADKDNRSLSNFVRVLLEKYVAEQEKQEQNNIVD